MSSKKCPGCGIEKKVQEFNFKFKSRGVRQVRCRACTRRQLRDHFSRNHAYYVSKARRRNQRIRKEHREFILAYLKAHPCVDCGETDILCLEFDHVRGQKKLHIAVMMRTHSRAALEAEIAKCEVRCANCHRRKTVLERGWYREAD